MKVDRHEPVSLPAPEAESLAHSRELVARIAGEVTAAGGWLPFSRFMESALYTPGLGYYSGANAKFGRRPEDGSDFVTAPELTPLFAQTLARPVAEALEASGTNDIIEFGAGTGKLAADLLAALDSLGMPCNSYTIVELSGELRERQRDTLARRAPSLAGRVRWVDRLPASFAGVALGNEVLDAMPVRLHARVAGEWFERGVALDADGHLAWSDRARAHSDDSDASGTLARMLAAIEGEHDYLTESHEAAAAFVSTVCTMLTRGAFFLIDYGFPRREYHHPQRTTGTLMCHYRHRAHGDPFFHPGLQDITAHVDFTAIAQAGIEAGATLLGYTSQARFLINAGVADALTQFDPGDAKTFLPIANAVQKLLSEAEMGELFKLIAFGRGLDAQGEALCAFSAGDRSVTLFEEPDDDDTSGSTAISPRVSP